MQPYTKLAFIQKSDDVRSSRNGQANWLMAMALNKSTNCVYRWFDRKLETEDSKRADFLDTVFFRRLRVK